MQPDAALPVAPPAAQPARRRQRISGYVLAAAGSVAAVGVAALVQAWFGLNDVSPVFMLAVLGVASRSRTGPAVVSALLCFLGYNFFFFEPRYTLYISARQGVATIVLFLAAALLAGRLASRLAMQVQALRSTNRQVRLRQELGQQLAAAADAEQIARSAAEFIGREFGAQASVHLSAAGAVATAASGWRYLDLGTPQARLGTLALRLDDDTAADENPSPLLQAMAEDIAQALLRARLVADLQSVRVANETERLRSALLSSVSHDLRTPLAAMLGAAESLESYGPALAENDRRALLATVREEGRRLDRYIQNLLDMTRLGHGELALKRDWIGIDELVGSALSRLQRYQPGSKFKVAIAADIGPVWVHPALLEQALFNVIENGVRFSPPGEAVAIEACRSGNGVRIDISDRGPGIPPDERERIFEMFHGIDRGDRGKSGTGLGLAICRGMIGAHGGTVAALGASGGPGTTMRIMLPLLAPDAAQARS